MTNIDFEYAGIDELLTELDEMQTRVKRGVNKVLKESAEPLKGSIESKINYSRKTGRTHAKDDVHITNVKSENDGLNRYVEVGYGKDTGWRMYFLEFGTYSGFSKAYSPASTHQKKRPAGGGGKGVEAQHIVQRATDDSREKIIAIQKAGLTRILLLRGTGESGE